MSTRTSIGSLLFYLGIVALTIVPTGTLGLFLLSMTKPNGHIGIGSPLNLVLPLAIFTVLGFFLVRGGIEYNPQFAVQRRRTMRRVVIVVVVVFLLSIIV